MRKKTTKYNLKQRAVKGMFWVATSNVISKVVSLGSLLYLARVLSKADFGIFSTISTLNIILFVAIQLGFDVWYIQAKNREKYHFAVFTKANIIFTTITSAILYIFSYQISQFYNEPELQNLLKYLGIYFLVGGTIQLLRQYLAKELEFQKTSIAVVVRQLVQAIISISLSIYFQNVYVLFIGFITGGVIEFMILLIPSGSAVLEALKRFFKVSIIRELRRSWKFNISVFGNKFINTVGRMIPPIILGKTLGFAATGLFTTMNQLIAQPIQLIIGGISTTSLAVLSKIPKRNLPQTSLRLSNVILLFTAPVFIILWIFAEELIGVFLGAKWIDGAYILRLLMIGTFINVVVSPISSNFSIHNKPHHLFWWNVVYFTGGIAILIPSGNFGLNSTVLYYTIFEIIMRVMLQIMMTRLLKIPWYSFFKIYYDLFIVWLPLIVLGIAVKLVYPNIWVIFATIVISTFLYFWLTKKFRRALYNQLKDIIYTAIKRS